MLWVLNQICLLLFSLLNCEVTDPVGIGRKCSRELNVEEALADIDYGLLRIPLAVECRVCVCRVPTTVLCRVINEQVVTVVKRHTQNAGDPALLRDHGGAKNLRVEG